jgi:putative serine protease
MKIAIIDSGIDSRIESNSIISKRNYTSETINDKLGHGTNMYRIISERCKSADYIICKVLNDIGTSTIDQCCHALSDLIDDDVDIVCMPVAIRNIVSYDKVKTIIKLCDKLVERGKVIICSYSNRDCESYPAKLDNVIGIFGGFFQTENEFWYYVEKKNIVVDFSPQCVRSIGGRREFFSGNSKACAVATAMLSNNVSDIKKIYEYLMYNAYKKEWNTEDINRNFNTILDGNYNTEFKIKINKAEFKTFCKNKLSKYIDDNFFENKIMVVPHYYDRIYHLEDILSRMEDYYRISIHPNMVDVKDFINFERLFIAINRWLND